MSTYCLDKSYFAFINISPTSTTEQGDGTTCYDFNDTKNDQPQVELTSKMISSLTQQENSNIVIAPQNHYYSSGYSTSSSFLTITGDLSKNGGLCSDNSTVNLFLLRITSLILGSTQASHARLLMCAQENKFPFSTLSFLKVFKHSKAKQQWAALQLAHLQYTETLTMNAYQKYPCWYSIQNQGYRKPHCTI